MRAVLKSLFTTASIAAGLLAVTSPANAAFTAKFNDLNGSLPGPYSVDVTVSGTSISNKTVTAGQFDWKLLGGDTSGLLISGTGSNAVFHTFCIEILQNVSSGTTYTFTPESWSSLPTSGPNLTTQKVNQLKQLWGALNPNSSTAVASLTAAGYNAGEYLAAFQVAVWAIVYGNGSVTYSNNTGSWDNKKDKIVSGNFTATVSANSTSVIDLTATWLTTLFGNGYNSYTSNITGFKLTKVGGGAAQDQIGELIPSGGGGGGPIPAPVPASAILVLTGFAPCLAFRRRLMGTSNS